MNNVIAALKQVLKILNASEKKSLAVVLVMMIIGMFFEMAGIGLVLPIFAIITAPEKILLYPGGQYIFEKISGISEPTLIIYSMGIIIIFAASKFLFLTALSYMQSKVTYDIMAGVSIRLFKGYMGAPYTFHLSSNSSKMVRNAVTEVQIFAQNFISPLLLLLTEVFVTLGILMVLMVIDPRSAGLSIIFIVIISVVFVSGTRKLSAKWGVSRQLHEGNRIKYIQEGLGCIKEITLLGKGRFYEMLYAKEAHASASVAGKQVFMGQIPRQILELVAMSAICMVVWINVADGKSMKEILPTLIMFAAAAFRMLPSINRILGSINALFYSFPSVKEVSTASIESVASNSKNNDISLSKFNMMELCDVHYSYSGAEVKGVANVSLVVKAGEMIGFIGETGSGKSTLLDLMLGLLKPTSGEILINSVALDDSLKSWRKKIGYVPQSINLVDDTIRKNIAFGIKEAEIDDKKISQALTTAQLDRFIKGLPDGLETKIGERGVRLSGGQRQRIGIARALYTQPEIIFFDEATSALDNETEADLMSSIEALHGRVTLIMIAHRLSSIKNCDRIYRLEKGVIMAAGTPSQMLR